MSRHLACSLLGALALILVLACGGSSTSGEDLSRLTKMVGDPEEYAAQVESRCAAGSARDCTSLGVHYAYGTYGRTQDYTQSRVYLEKACDGGDAQGCHELGVLCMYGRGLEADHARAQAIFAESCAGGVSSSCRDMGDYFSTGRGGTPKDPAQARQWYQRACDAGDEGSCDQARN